MDRYKIANIGDQQQIGQQSNLYQGILLTISQTVIIQTHGILILKSHYYNVIDNSQTFWTMRKC